MHNYQMILRQVVYFNRKPAYYLNRAFKLTCSELNGRFTSNDYIQTLTVIHPKVDSQTQSQSQQQNSDKFQHPNDHILTDQLQSVAHAQIHEQKVEFKEAHIKTANGFMDGSTLMDAGDAFGKTSASKFKMSRTKNELGY